MYKNPRGYRIPTSKFCLIGGFLYTGGFTPCLITIVFHSRTKALEEETTLGILPQRLRTEIAIHVHLETLKKVTPDRYFIGPAKSSRKGDTEGEERAKEEREMIYNEETILQGKRMPLSFLTITYYCMYYIQPLYYYTKMLLEC